MPKNNFKELLANNEITLDLAFNNLLLIANVINNKELLKWVEREISGYTENDVLPVYRRSEKSMHFVYSGLNGTYPINNAPMPITYFPEDVRAAIINFKILEGVKTIERQLSVKENEWSLMRDCTEYAADVYANTGIQCFSIGQILQKSQYEKVYDTVKFHLMKILLMIEKSFGTLDTFELETKKFEKQRILEAAKDISAYVVNLHKTAISAPRISIPPQTLGNDSKNLPKQAPAQQPVYQPQQPVYQPQPPIMQQPVYQPIYQQQLPVMEPAQIQDSQQQIQQTERDLTDLSSSYEEAKDGQFLDEQKSDMVEPDKTLSESGGQAVEPFQAKQEMREEANLEKQESNDAAAKAKAAEIRKDRVPKSLLDYLEEKKAELSKKPE